MTQSITPKVIAEIRARHEADKKDTRFERLDNQAHADRATLLRLIAEKDAEIERLREALKKIANPNTQITEIDEKYDEPVTFALDMWHAREVARAALNQELTHE